MTLRRHPLRNTVETPEYVSTYVPSQTVLEGEIFLCTHSYHRVDLGRSVSHSETDLPSTSPRTSLSSRLVEEKIPRAPDWYLYSSIKENEGGSTKTKNKKTNKIVSRCRNLLPWEVDRDEDRSHSLDSFLTSVFDFVRDPPTIDGPRDPFRRSSNVNFYQ